ncbi:hypothetical protein Tco_0687114 [Tanacetum coccineum]
MVRPFKVLVPRLGPGTIPQELSSSSLWKSPVKNHGNRRQYRLKRSRIPLVKVRWNSRRGPEFTWEREDSFKQKYPQLFTNQASSSTTRS